MQGDFTTDTVDGRPPEDKQENSFDHEQAAPLPPLTPQQQELVRGHMGLVGVHLGLHVPAPRFPKRHREYKDLFQEGCLALARAAARYDPRRDGDFAPYALYRIRSAVHRAIHSRFTLIYIPTRARMQLRKDPQKAKPPACVTEINDELEESMTIEHQSSEPCDTIRHALRDRFELAVARTLEQMRQRQWRQRDPSDIMECIARKRLLITSRRRRTTMRQIGRDFGVSTSRINSYERILENEIKREFRNDPQVRALMQMAHEASNGRNALMDDERCARLREAEVAAFEERFSRMPPAMRAETIYSLIERSTNDVPEIARNLFSIALSVGGGPVRTVA